MIIMRLFLVFILLQGLAFGQEIWMQPNEGQWDNRIEYKVDLQMGEMLIEKDGFTYYLNDANQKLRHSHGENHNSFKEHTPDFFDAQVIRSKFLGSSWEGMKIEKDSTQFYNNYLIGNDRSKWKSRIHNYSDITLIDFYPEISLHLNGKRGYLKYSLEVEANVDASVIKIEYTGQDKIYIDKKGQLILKNRFGEIIEGNPIAWVEDEYGKEFVKVKYKLSNNVISFVFPRGYDHSKRLIIDPSITFSTFTGSTADNWGMSATPDQNANLIGGGVVFDLGYPISSGAYDASFNGGTVDIGITKFNSTGTAAIFSTYIGGIGSDTPNSMICNQSNELFIFGLTSSADFPMSGSPFDNIFNGGPDESNNANGLGFTQGVDMFVAHLSSDGSTMIASTFVGGSSTDGLNSSILRYGYGDQFRGEIILDDNDNVYVTSMTKSSNFPVSGSGQSSISGSQDAIVFKMPPTLNSMTWSSYYGGALYETGNSIQLSSTGDVFIVGGSTSSNIPSSLNSFSGGLSDGYLARIDGNTGAIISSRYIGALEYDQTYFVQLDIEDNVYILGQTESDLGISSGLYGNANSGQFIQKFTPDISTLIWKTMIGASTGHVEISPTAFLVSDCHDIYLAGWGGSLNLNPSLSQALNSTTNGFPVTADAYQLNTTGSNFYIGVLSEDAGFLKYGTFMGGNTTSPDHVDGGTSRFDKEGRIYHAVCAACGGDPNGFTTTPGVFSPTNNSIRCNLAAFKFELSTIEALVTDPAPVVCLPDAVFFTNNSANGNAFFWDFNDGSTSTDVNPSHIYPGPGNYDVTLIVSDTNGCYTSDTIVFPVYIGDFVGYVSTPPGPICPNVPYQLEASNGVNYSWTPAQFLDDPSSATPIATVSQTTVFTVIASDTCGSDTLQVTLEVYDPPYTVSNDTSICIGNSVQIFATGGVNYAWTPAVSLNDTSISSPTATPSNTTLYYVDIETPEGCILRDSVLVTVFFTPPVPNIPDSISICFGESTTINVSGAEYYSWSPNLNISSTTGASVSVQPTTELFYYCDFTNACGTERDSVYIQIIRPDITAGNDTIFCIGETATLWVTGGISYLWAPPEGLNNLTSSLVYATPNIPTMYYVTGTDQYGCTDRDSVFVDLYPRPFIQTNPNVYAFLGDDITLSATSSTVGSYVWSPSEHLSCVDCPSPIAHPDQNYTYTVTYTDNNGCKASDNVQIFYDPIIYIPNTFTPEGNEFNPVFLAKGGNIKTFEMRIFNRWGEEIFTSNDITIGWDGTYNGKICQDGTYVWKVKITGFEDQEQELVGHINLLR